MRYRISEATETFNSFRPQWAPGYANRPLGKVRLTPLLPPGQSWDDYDPTRCDQVLELPADILRPLFGDGNRPEAGDLVGLEVELNLSLVASDDFRHLDPRKVALWQNQLDADGLGTIDLSPGNRLGLITKTHQMGQFVDPDTGESVFLSVRLPVAG